MRGSRVSWQAAVTAVVSVTLLTLGLLALGVARGDAADAGGMEAMSLDLDVTGNTATSLGPRDGCVEARPGDLVTVDVTALNIPAAAPMIGFNFVIGYQEAAVRVETQDAQFLLAANPGSAIFNLSEATPDQDSSDSWEANALDLSSTPPEAGSGILSRLGVSVGRDAPNGQYVLMLMSGYYLDFLDEYGFPKVLNGATVSVGIPCPAATSTPFPSPTASPTPPPSPTPAPSPRITSVTFEPEVRLLPGNESVIVRGTVTCPSVNTVEIAPAVYEVINEGRVFATGAQVVQCEGETAWGLTLPVFQGEQGDKFRPGLGHVTVIASDGIEIVGSSGAVRLKPGNAK